MATAAESPTRYGLVAIILHWAIALSILGMLIMGFVFMENENLSLSQRYELFQWHKSIGITILLLSLFRLGWRLGHPPPALPDTLKPWERIAARVTHWGFYGVMIGMPLTGWLIVSTSPLNVPTVLYGLIPWPHLPFFADAADPQAISDRFAGAHEVLAFGAIGLVFLHVGAALKHHFVLKDDVLIRMLPLLRRRPDPTVEDTP